MDDIEGKLAQLEGKKVIITGVSTGIGEELMKQASEHGAQVVGTYWHTKEHEKRDGVKLLKMDAGETTARKVDANAGMLLDALGGKPDIVIYNAGVIGATHHFEQVPLTERVAEWKDVMDTNLNGPIFLYHSLGATTGANHHAVHAFTGSVARVVAEMFNAPPEGAPLPPGVPGLDPYALTRTAMAAFAHSVNNEIAGNRAHGAPTQTRVALLEYQFVGGTKIGNGVVRMLGVPSGEVAATLTPYGKPVPVEMAAQLGLISVVNRYNAEPGAKMGDTLIPPRK